MAGSSSSIASPTAATCWTRTSSWTSTSRRTGPVCTSSTCPAAPAPPRYFKGARGGCGCRLAAELPQRRRDCAPVVVVLAHRDYRSTGAGVVDAGAGGAGAGDHLQVAGVQRQHPPALVEAAVHAAGKLGAIAA